MSENKRSRKYSNLKEHKQRTILAKTTDSDVAEPPKILLKAKEKPAAVVSTAPPASPTITIATREPAAIIIAKPPLNSAQPAQSSNGPAIAVIANTGTSANSAVASPVTPLTQSASPSLLSTTSATANKSPPASAVFITPPQPQTTAVDQSSPPGAAAAAAAAAVEKVPKMPGPLPLINEHQQLCVSPLNNYLLDTNHQFFVVGVLGTQSAGKSTLLNMLLLPANAADAAPTPDRAPYDQLLQLLNSSSGGCSAGSRFPVQRSTAGPPASTAPTAVDGVQMYVTDDRHVLLDCTPLLCNGQKRDPLTSEMDDLRLVALMLSVCQTVLVVDSGAANMALMRLLHMAELMKPSLDLEAAAATPTPTLSPAKYPDQLHVAGAHYPSVMFVHNRAEHWHFEPGHAERMRRLYARCFGQSRLRMFGGNVRAALAGGSVGEPASGGGGLSQLVQVGAKGGARKTRELPLNLFTMPRFAAGGKVNKRSGAGQMQQDVATYVQQFRRWVLMAPRVAFVQSASAPPMSEKSWGVLVQAVWDSHKGSYFMRKYEVDLSAKAVV